MEMRREEILVETNPEADPKMACEVIIANTYFFLQLGAGSYSRSILCVNTINPTKAL